MTDILFCLVIYLCGVPFFYGFFYSRVDHYNELIAMSVGWPIMVPLRIALWAGRWLTDIFD